MEAFIELFYKIDTNENRVITLDELSTYAKNNHLDQTLVQRWKELFDKANTGKITLAKFLEVLGLREEDYINYKKSFKAMQLGKDIIYISGDMSVEDQIKVSDLVRQNYKSLGDQDLQNLARQIKAALDKSMQRAWHVVIVPKNFAAAYTYETDYSFVFKMNNNVYTIWKTPSDSRSN